MFSTMKKFIGVITVHERGGRVFIDGLPSGPLMASIKNVWSTSKIEQYMFTRITGSSLSFNSFFALDFAYALTAMLNGKHKCNRRAVKQILEQLYENTWLSRLNEEHPDIVNWSKLDDLTINILPTQRTFIETYNKLVPKYLLKGYLLGAAPGTGKAQPLTANIKIPDGWAKMGDMYVGAKVMTPRGTVTKVIGVYPQGMRAIYRITLADGSQTECCLEHLWKVSLNGGVDWIVISLQELLHERIGTANSPLLPVTDDNYIERHAPIMAIEFIGKKEAQCIEVADEEHLYITDDYIVTHNTIAGLSLATVLEADAVFCVVPKNAVNKVWEDTVSSIFKTPVTYWLSNDGSVPQVGRKVYITHYEALDRLVQFIRTNMGYWKKPVVLLDESHNLNEIDSARTQNFIAMCKLLDAKHVIWASGTPLKAAGKEVAPLMHTIDSFFNEDASARFMGVFGKSATRALDILANRMGLVTFKVDKATAVGNKINDYTIKVKIPNGEDYTLDSIREVMKQFITERMAFYKKNFRLYESTYEQCVAIYEKSIHGNPSAIEKLKLYRSYISMIRKGYDPVTMKDMAFFCNQFELNQIMQALPQHLKADFKDCRSVVKYYDLKVQGEALGRILGKMRAQCHVDMLPHAPLAELIEDSEKKTVIFTSYVEVVKAAETMLAEDGFKPILVYGETNKDLPAIVNKFRDDVDTNPLVATYKSLSTAVPLIMANTVILLNAPFRDYERQQATSRVDRLGQDCEVNIVTIMLDTGEKPNISTRSGDILDWSREQVEQIMGVKAIELGVECYADLVPDDNVQQTINRPAWSSW